MPGSDKPPDEIPGEIVHTAFIESWALTDRQPSAALRVSHSPRESFFWKIKIFESRTHGGDTTFCRESLLAIVGKIHGKAASKREIRFHLRLANALGQTENRSSTRHRRNRMKLFFAHGAFVSCVTLHSSGSSASSIPCGR
jgi:hypothetical protein